MFSRYNHFRIEHIVLFTIPWLWWIILALKKRVSNNVTNINQHQQNITHSFQKWVISLGGCMHRLYYYRAMGVMLSFNHTKTWYTCIYHIYVYISHICHWDGGSLLNVLLGFLSGEPTNSPTLAIGYWNDRIALNWTGASAIVLTRHF